MLAFVAREVWFVTRTKHEIRNTKRIQMLKIRNAKRDCFAALAMTHDSLATSHEPRVTDYKSTFSPFLIAYCRTDLISSEVGRRFILG